MSNMRLLVRGGRALSGNAEVPPDKSILHRALLLGALGDGPTRVHPLGAGADNRSTLSALQALGVEARVEGDAARLVGVRGPSGLSQPAGPVDCGNSGTTIRLLSGVIAACPGLSVTLDGDASLRRRPMERLRPLEAMGAQLFVEGDDTRPLFAPFVVEGRALVGTEHTLRVASAQVKSAILLAGLNATGPTVVTEPRASRDHTERMLEARGVPIRRTWRADGAHEVRIEPCPFAWRLEETRVPPDVSSATFLLAAAALTKGQIAVRTGVNPTRTGALDALEAMGVSLLRAEETDWAGEPVALVEASCAGPLRPHEIRGEQALRAIDELPMLAGLALYAPGTTTIADAAELRVKESDRIAEVARVLSAFGGQVETRDDGVVVRGGTPLRPGKVDAAGDHRIAMMAAVVALGIPGETTIDGAEVIGVSFPGFVETLGALGADLHTEPGG